MEWFSGSIPDAINTSRTRKSLLIVYITGADDISKEMDNTWNYGEIAKTCRDGQCVSLKLESNSESCQQFSQVYPVVLVPSTFFIGIDNTALEVIGGHVGPDQFSEKIQKVLQIHTEQVNRQVPVNTSQGASSPGTSTTQNTELTNRARELIDEHRLQKAKEEEEAAKKQEIQRRKLGKDLADLKKMKADREAKEIRDQIKKDKEEEKKAREKVRAQLARDKAEKNARFQKEKEERDNDRKIALEEKTASQSKEKEEQERIAFENARIQFRLPDGSSVNQLFLASENLEKAKQFVIQHTNGRLQQFTLQTTYPKRQFTSDDLSKTFTELSLAPSAVLIVIPGIMKGSTSKKPEGGDSVLGNILWFIPSLFIALWAFICTFLFGSSQAESQQTHSSHQASNSEGSSEQGKYSSDRSQSTYQRRPIRPQGNIHRLTDPREDDKDKDPAYWNGNSTQQL